MGTTSHAGPPLIEFHDVTVAYGRRPVVWHVDLNVDTACLFGIIGPNGAGKSTMFKAICGLVNHSGNVEVNGVHCHDRTDRMDLAYIPQRNDSDLNFPITVGELVLAGRRRFHRWYQRPSADDHQRAEESLERVLLHGVADRALTELSGGQ